MPRLRDRSPWRPRRLLHVSPRLGSPNLDCGKAPRLARKQGAYSSPTRTGQVLKRGHELRQVLKIFDKRRFNVVD
jgi:hypothetical protein